MSSNSRLRRKNSNKHTLLTAVSKVYHLEIWGLTGGIRRDILGKNMRTYELVVILEPKEEEKKKTLAKVKEILGKEAKILKEENWGIKALVYPIKKLREGEFIQIDFEAENAAVAEIDKKLRQLETLLRFLLVRKEVGKGVRKDGQ